MTGIGREGAVTEQYMGGVCLDFHYCLYFPSRCVSVCHVEEGAVHHLILLLVSWGSFKVIDTVLKLTFLLLNVKQFESLHQAPSQISLCTQFSQYLHENAFYVRPLEEGMLQLFESITEDTVTVLVRFLTFSIKKDFNRAEILTLFFFPGNSCEIEGLFRTFSFILMLFKKDSSLSVKKVLFILV